MAEKGSNWLIDSMDHINSFLIWLGFRSHDITDRLGFCSMCDCSFWNVNLAYGAAESGFCTDGPDNRIVPYRISSTNLDSVRRFRFRKVHTVSMFPCTMGEHVVMAPCARLIILVWSYICRWWATWKERNARKHGEGGRTMTGSVQWVLQTTLDRSNRSRKEEKDSNAEGTLKTSRAGYYKDQYRCKFLWWYHV
jgi:hypothetical protein